MFICNCNAITDKQVDAAIENGCAKPLDIYAKCGHEPQCGRCMERMWSMLSEAGIAIQPTQIAPAE